MSGLLIRGGTVVDGSGGRRQGATIWRSCMWHVPPAHTGRLAYWDRLLSCYGFADTSAPVLMSGYLAQSMGWSPLQMLCRVSYS